MSFNSSSSSPLRAAEVLLRDLVSERTGLHFDDGKLDLFTAKLTPLVLARGFGSLLDYYYLLKYDAAQQQAWDDTISALTVQETYFWREMDQVHALAEIVIPSLVRQAPGQPIRIWSAACATGEEPLTLAMRLEEEGWFERANIEIIASDASKDAIAQAVEGNYCGRSFRSLPEHLKAKYFTPVGKCYSVSRSLHERVRWETVNLMDGNAVSTWANGVNVIFCRNVFIYFDLPATRRVVDSFAKLIKVPGYLFVGAAESLMKVTDYFELEEIGNAFVYTKRS